VGIKGGSTLTKQAAVTKREQPEHRVLFEGSVASVKISRKARRGTLPTDKRVRFFQYAVHMKGGCINVFLHSDDASHLGRYVRARIKIIEKIFADGRTYIHIDLFPVDDAVQETNRLFIVPHVDVTPKKHWMVFETSGPQGCALIILAGLTDDYPHKENLSVVNIATAGPAKKPELSARTERVALPETDMTRTVKPKPGKQNERVGSLADLHQLLVVE
jgi:hypothetical protein